MMDLSFVICTLDRHELLRAAVASCLGQVNAAGRAYEIVVVDNSPDGNAREVVCAIDAGGVPLRYVAEARTNISHARNAGVAAARGRFVAFMDDDMAAPPEWIDRAFDTIERSRADVVFGRIVPLFEDEAGSNLREPRRWFTYTFALPDGARVPVKPSGHVEGGRTGNCTLRRSHLLAEPGPFDPSFGHTGGEDTELLQRLGRKGLVMVFSERAWMTEFVPATRSTPAYLARREYRGSQNFVRSAVQHSPHKRLTACRHAGTGAAQLALAVVRYGAAKAAGADPVPARVAAASALGKIFWMRRGPVAPHSWRAVP